MKHNILQLRSACVWCDSFSTSTHMLKCSRIPPSPMALCIDDTKKSCFVGVGYCYCCHLMWHTCYGLCFITRRKPLAHCLVFPISFSPSSAHGRMFDRGMVQDTVGVSGTLVLFCALVSKLIARWCFSTKRMRNQCCCICSWVKRAQFYFRRKKRFEIHYEYGKRACSLIGMGIIHSEKCQFEWKIKSVSLDGLNWQWLRIHRAIVVSLKRKS